MPNFNYNHTKCKHRDCTYPSQTSTLNFPYVKNDSRKIIKYHQSGTCLYLLINLAWISGCSLSDLLAWAQICLRKYKNACTIVAVILAKLKPYDIANVVDRNKGLYCLYFSMSIVVCGVRMRETLYGAPVLSKEPPERIGMY